MMKNLIETFVVLHGKLIKDMSHVHCQPKVLFNQNFSVLRHKKISKKANRFKGVNNIDFASS